MTQVGCAVCTREKCSVVAGRNLSTTRAHGAPYEMRSVCPAKFANIADSCYSVFMCKLLIKLNIFALLLILPLQGFAAASMLHCQMMNAGKIATSQMSAMHKMKADSSQAEQMSEHCLRMQKKATEDTGDTPNTICPHCSACGIYAPALLTSLEPITVQFESHSVYRDIDSHFTSFIPQRPLHPPSQL